MAMSKETLGKLSAGFAAGALVVPFVIGFTTAALGVEEIVNPVYSGPLCLFLLGVALACAKSAWPETGARIGLSTSLVILALFAVAAAFQYHHMYLEPADRVLAFQRALRNQDWRTLWDLTVFTAMQRRVWRTPQIYERDMQQNLEDTGARQAFDTFSQIRNFSVEKGMIIDREAQIPTSATMTVNGRVHDLQGMAHLRDEDGSWKVVISNTDNDDPYTGYCRLLGIPYTPRLMPRQR